MVVAAVAGIATAAFAPVGCSRESCQQQRRWQHRAALIRIAFRDSSSTVTEEQSASGTQGQQERLRVGSMCSIAMYHCPNKIVASLPPCTHTCWSPVHALPRLAVWLSLSTSPTNSLPHRTSFPSSWICCSTQWLPSSCQCQPSSCLVSTVLPNPGFRLRLQTSRPANHKHVAFALACTQRIYTQTTPVWT